MAAFQLTLRDGTQTALDEVDAIESFKDATGRSLVVFLRHRRGENARAGDTHSDVLLRVYFDEIASSEPSVPRPLP